MTTQTGRDSGLEGGPNSMSLNFNKYALGEERYLYTFIGGNSTDQVKEFVEKILKENEGSVFLCGGCHGDKSGENWRQREGGENWEQIYKKELCASEVVNYMKEDVAEFKLKYPGRRIVFINMASISAEEMFNIFDQNKNSSFIMGYCFSDKDEVVRIYLE